MNYRKSLEFGLKCPILLDMARSFIHPSSKDFTIDAVLYALSDPIRREIVKKLYAKLDSNGEGMCCNKACDQLSPSTISFHHKILRESGLIRSEKIGVEVVNTLRADELNNRFPGLLDSILKNHKSAPKSRAPAAAEK